MRRKRMSNIFNLNEVCNAVAITAELHANKRWQEFYDHLNIGSMGIYDVCRDLGVELAKYEQEYPDIWDNELLGLSWPEVIDCIVDDTLTFGIKNSHVDGSTLEDIVKQIIYTHMEPDEEDERECEENNRTVRVIVRGGVAEVIACPKDIIVDIHDYDNEEE
jgi:hypothetical protein